MIFVVLYFVVSCFAFLLFFVLKYQHPPSLSCLQVKADHTRLAALEVNIAVRSSSAKGLRNAGANNNNHNNQHNESCALEDHLQWLSGLSKVQTDEKQPQLQQQPQQQQHQHQHEQQGSAYERDRLEGLRGTCWVTANLHSKLLTAR